MADATPTGNAFLDMLTEIRGGETLADLHHQIVALVGNVRSVGKAGTLTLTLKVETAKGTPSTLVITDEVKTKDPLPDREITILYADDANRLSRRDPRQPRLPEMPAGEVKKFARPMAVNSATGEITE